MKFGSVLVRTSLLIVLALPVLFVLDVSAQDQKSISQLKIDDTTTIRFLYRRLNPNYVLPALILRVADVGSSNWGTAPIDEYGRSPYISSSEMQALVHQLQTAHALWQVASTREPMEPFEKVGPNKELFITIYAKNGTATVRIPLEERCKYLSELNKIIEAKRAHWEFEYFRQGCGCHVPGYKADAYPNHR